MQLTALFNDLIQTLEGHPVFYGHGVAMAEDEVVLLLMSVLGVDFETLNEMANAEIEPLLVQQAKNLLQVRIDERKPMAYVVGFSVFAGLKFTIDARALIPRSPFVDLIDVGFAPWTHVEGVERALDLCTGSGCIGLAMAHYFPTMHVDLVDLSDLALQLAEKNRQNLALTENTRCVQSNLFATLDGRYDLIVSNPPYVSQTEYDDLPAEFGHEPAMALVSAVDGLGIPVQILRDAANHLTDHGRLFLEVGYSDKALAEALPEVPFEWVELPSGGQGICVFNRSDLLKYRSHFEQFLKHHV